jgi:hypothetical protein
MRQIAEAYKKTLSPEQKALAEQRAKQRVASETRKKQMLANMIANFKSKFPTADKALEYILANRTMPNKTAAKIFLKAIYGLSKEDVNKMLPGKRVKARRYKPIVEKEFLEAAPVVSVSTAPEEEELEEVIKEAPQHKQQPPPKTVPKKSLIKK